MIRRRVRRVRRVRLRASGAADVRRGALLLEDALRTASVPSGPGPGVLLVRSLDVGAIRRRGSPAGLAVAVERRLAHLASGAVRAGTPGAERADAVWFADPVEPLVLLSVRLASGGDPTGWFWSAAVPAWRPDRPRRDALRAILFAALDTDAGPAAGVRVVTALVEGGAAEPLLAGLGPGEGTALLEGFGWDRPDEAEARHRAPGSTPEHTDVPPSYRELLAGWVPRWGARDPRAGWLGGVALAAGRPARVARADLARRGAEVAARVWDAGGGLRSRPEGASPGRAPKPRDPGAGVSHAGGPHSGPERARRWTDTPTDRGIRAAPSPPEDPDGGERDRTRGASRRSGASGPGSPTRWTSPPALSSTRDGRPSGRAAPSSPTDRRTASMPYGLERTAHAGLFFLWPVLERLGVTELLEGDPRLVERDPISRLLRRVALRLGAPPDDPVLRALGPPPEEDTRPLSFTLPGDRWVGVADVRRFSVARAGRRRRVLRDGTGRLPLAAWRSPSPPEVRRWVDGAPVTRSPEPAAEGPLDLLLTALRRGAGRWTLRQVRIGLHTLVCRPGRVGATSTHVDVVFDLGHAEPMIRRAGLDLDPGWIPWLGRVVAFHYLRGGGTG